MDERFDVREIELYNVIGVHKTDIGEIFREIWNLECRNILFIKRDKQSKSKYILVDTRFGIVGISSFIRREIFRSAEGENISIYIY